MWTNSSDDEFDVEEDEDEHEDEEEEVILPPTVRPQPGRPRRLKKRGGVEGVLHNKFRGADCAVWSDIRRGRAKGLSTGMP
jgi:hypothetical protein